jgi:hypothetical protein
MICLWPLQIGKCFFRPLEGDHEAEPKFQTGVDVADKQFGH